MPNINEVSFSGHLGKDIEIKTGKSGKKYCQFNLGITTGKDDYKKTVWPRITLFGEKAEYVAQFGKGDILEFEELQYNQDEAEKDGQKITYHGFSLPPWGKVTGTKKGEYKKEGAKQDKPATPEKPIDPDSDLPF